MTENTAEWPVRGQKAPEFWDTVLQTYTDTGDSLSIPAQTITRVVKLTRPEYDALEPKLDTTLYIVVPVVSFTLPLISPLVPNSSDATEVGGASPLADESDLSYVEWTAEPVVLNFANAITDLVFDYPGEEPPPGTIELVLRWSLTGGDAPAERDTFLFLQDLDGALTTDYGQFTDGAYGEPWIPPAPRDGTIQDVTLPLVMNPDFTIIQAITCLGNTPYLRVNTFSNGEAGPPVGRIYKADIVYTIA